MYKNCNFFFSNFFAFFLCLLMCKHQCLNNNKNSQSHGIGKEVMKKHHTFHTVQNTNKMGRDLYIHRAFLIVNWICDLLWYYNAKNAMKITLRETVSKFFFFLEERGRERKAIGHKPLAALTFWPSLSNIPTDLPVIRSKNHVWYNKFPK